MRRVYFTKFLTYLNKTTNFFPVKNKLTTNALLVSISTLVSLFLILFCGGWLAGRLEGDCDSFWKWTESLIFPSQTLVALHRATRNSQKLALLCPLPNAAIYLASIHAGFRQPASRGAEFRLIRLAWIVDKQNWFRPRRFKNLLGETHLIHLKFGEQKLHCICYMTLFRK